MSDPLSLYNQHIESAIRREDGTQLRELLRIRSLEAAHATEIYIVEGGSVPSPMPDAWEVIPDIVQKRFAAGGALTANDWVSCSEHLSECLTAFINVVQSESAWVLPALHALCTDLRVVAGEADKQLFKERMKKRMLEKSERILKRAFMTTNNDRRTMEEGSKRAGTLAIINQLLKVYFSLNNLRLCANLTRTVNAPNFPPFENYSISDRVTYKFFSGRLHLYDDRVREATVDLTYAFSHMHQDQFENLRHVLLYLIPAQILTGLLPSEKMLRKYNMHWYMKISEAIRTGNLRLFDDAVEQYEEFFITRALWLAVEKMRPLVYRSLIRRVGNSISDGTEIQNKIPLDKIRIALLMCQKEMDLDEIECVVANLIYCNYIKGYISHKVGYLVLSKKDPFPQLQV